MNLHFQQLKAIMRTEMRMNWRRGGLRLLGITLISATLFPFILASFDRGTLTTEANLPLAVARVYRTSLMIETSLFFLPVAMFLTPLLAGELFPIDQQYKTRELLFALPLPKSVYLGGKLLSFWGFLGVILLVCGLLNGVLMAQRGPYDGGIFLAYWVTAVIPLTLFAAQMGLSLAVNQPSRRRGILFGLWAILLTLVAYFVLPTQDFIFNSLLQSMAVITKPDKVADGSILLLPHVFTLTYFVRLTATALFMGLVWALTLRALEKSAS